MRGSSIFTRSNWGLDQNVWLSMIICVILCGGLMGYRASHREKSEPCEKIDMLIEGNVRSGITYFKLGNPISFKLPVSSAANVRWDFGNGDKTKSGVLVLYRFDKVGRFVVRASLNGKCSYEKIVVIEKQEEPALTDSAGREIIGIIGKDKALTGEKLLFSTTLPATSYEWYVEDNKFFAKQKGSKANFKFLVSGDYVIALIPDNDIRRKVTKTVSVSKIEKLIKEGEDLPPLPIPIPKHDSDVVKPPIEIKPQAEIKHKKSISNENLKEFIQAVVCNNMNPAQFEELLCDGQATKVLANGKAMTFAQLCAEIQGKKYKIESATAVRECEDKAISSITVKYDTKRVLGIFAKDPCN